MDNLDDILGAPKSAFLDDLLGPAPKKRKARKPRSSPASVVKHKKLAKPKKPLEGGIFDLRAKAEKAGTLGKKCLIDGVNLKKSRNGQRVICDKYECFRKYRNAYRAEYDRTDA